MEAMDALNSGMGVVKKKEKENIGGGGTP